MIGVNLIGQMTCFDAVSFIQSINILSIKCCHSDWFIIFPRDRFCFIMFGFTLLMVLGKCNWLWFIDFHWSDWRSNIKYMK